MMKTQNIKGKLLSNQIATRNTKEKKAGQVELARKLCYKFSCAFSGISRSCAGPLGCILWSLLLTRH